MNSERIEGAAFALAGRATVNADRAANAADVQRRGWIELAALTPAVRTAVAAGILVVGVVMESGRADPAAVAVAGRVAVNAPVLWPRLEETDSLGRGIHGRSDVIIATIYRVHSRFIGQKRA